MPRRSLRAASAKAKALRIEQAHDSEGEEREETEPDAAIVNQENTNAQQHRKDMREIEERNRKAYNRYLRHVARRASESLGQGAAAAATATATAAAASAASASASASAATPTQSWKYDAERASNVANDGIWGLENLDDLRALFGPSADVIVPLVIAHTPINSVTLEMRGCYAGTARWVCGRINGQDWQPDTNDPAYLPTTLASRAAASHAIQFAHTEAARVHERYKTAAREIQRYVVAHQLGMYPNAREMDIDNSLHNKMMVTMCDSIPSSARLERVQQEFRETCTALHVRLGLPAALVEAYLLVHHHPYYVNLFGSSSSRMTDIWIAKWGTRNVLCSSYLHILCNISAHNLGNDWLYDLWDTVHNSSVRPCRYELKDTGNEVDDFPAVLKEHMAYAIHFLSLRE
jgi:hypothetical protein